MTTYCKRSTGNSAQPRSLMDTLPLYSEIDMFQSLLVGSRLHGSLVYHWGTQRLQCEPVEGDQHSAYVAEAEKTEKTAEDAPACRRVRQRVRHCLAFSKSTAQSIPPIYSLSMCVPLSIRASLVDYGGAWVVERPGSGTKSVADAGAAATATRAASMRRRCREIDRLAHLRELLVRCES